MVRDDDTQPLVVDDGGDADDEIQEVGVGHIQVPQHVEVGENTALLVADSWVHWYRSVGDSRVPVLLELVQVPKLHSQYTPNCCNDCDREVLD